MTGVDPHGARTPQDIPDRGQDGVAMMRTRRPGWWRPFARRQWAEAEAARLGRKLMRDNAGTVTRWVVTREGTRFLGQRRIGEPWDVPDDSWQAEQEFADHPDYREEWRP